MRYLLSLVVIVLCNWRVQSLPIPAGQIIQYSVSSKYFNRNNATANNLYNILSQIHYGGNAESSTALSQLDQINQATTVLNENDETTFAPMEQTDSNESAESLDESNDVMDSEKKHQQLEIDAIMSDNTANNDNIFTALIEKVVNEQIQKLATESNGEIKKNLLNEKKDEIVEKSDLVDESTAISNTEKAPFDSSKNDDDDNDSVGETTIHINTEKTIEIKAEEDERMDKVATTIIPAMSIIESVDLDSESESTNVPTNQPELTTSMETILADNTEQNKEQQQDDNSESSEEQTLVEIEKVSQQTNDDKQEIPDTLMEAIGDLLSSVLGIPYKLVIESNDENIQTASPIIEDEIVSETTVNDNLEHSTEQELSTSTSVLEFNENITDQDEIKAETTTDVDNNNKSVDEVDMPQQTVDNVNTNEIDLKIENLANVHDTSFMTEDTPEVYTETVKESTQQDEIENLDEILEAQPAVEEAPKPVTIEESVNQIMNLVKANEDRLAFENAENVVDSILIDHKTINDNVNQILKGALKEIETNFGMNEADTEIEIPSDTIDLLDREREEMIRNFETDINESLANSNPDDHENFEPNMAKAALFHRFQYGDDIL